MFKKEFLWGGDISATQIEGGWNEDGKSPTETDYLLGGNKNELRYAFYKTPDGKIGKLIQHADQLPKGAKFFIDESKHYPNHKASDFYHRYVEDIAMLGELGIKALNLSISWARILPKGIQGKVNKKGVEFYKKVFQELKKYNIEPIVTLYKYDMPALFIEEYGGWSNRKLIDEYIAFARICMEAYKEDVMYWITFNEINVAFVMMNLNPSAMQEHRQRVFEESHHQLVASASVVNLGHVIQPRFKIGCMVAGVFSYPLTTDPEDQMMNLKIKQDIFYYFADTVIRGEYPSYTQRVWQENQVTNAISEKDKKVLQEGTVDFLAYSYYSTSCITTHQDDVEKTSGNLFSGVKNPYLKESEWGWTIDSEGIKISLHELYDRYQKPLLIVENGIGAIDTLGDDHRIHDDYRIDYHRKHIMKIKEAVEEGVDLFGYTMWSCIDLISFSTGELRKRYGFIYVDADDEGNGTYHRYKKDSFDWYRKVIEANGEEL